MTTVTKVLLLLLVTVPLVTCSDSDVHRGGNGATLEAHRVGNG